MCIAASVGKGGVNGHDDVRTVQLLLNLNRAAGSAAGSAPVAEDGACGAGTVAAIERFQQGLSAAGDAFGLVVPGGKTVEALRAALPAGLTAETLQGIYIHAPAAAIERFLTPLLAGMDKAAIDTPLRQAHFLAQVGQESGELRYTEEIASGSAYEGNKHLGNTEAGDGPRFKGRGLIQLTGRANYALFSKACGQDFCAPGGQDCIATTPALAVEAATWYWTTHKLNALADRDDVVGITRAVNGGENGLANRKLLLARAKWFLRVPSEEPHPPAPVA